MDAQLLAQAGLNPTQAKAYLVLIAAGSLTPPELASKAQLARTNAYEVLKQLADLGLATKTGSAAKTTYRPANPVALEKLMETQRNQVIEQENRLRSLMPQLMSYFYTYSEQPGVRFFQGKDGLVKVYEDILRTRQPLCIIRTPAERLTFGKPIVQHFIKERIKLGITAEAITPYRPNANKDPQVDAAQLFSRTFLPETDYDEPVEVDIYGDKVAILSFGQELTGIIIESPQIAQAMRQLFRILQVGAEQLFRAQPELTADLAVARARLAGGHPSQTGS